MATYGQQRRAASASLLSVHAADAISQQRRRPGLLPMGFTRLPASEVAAEASARSAAARSRRCQHGTTLLDSCAALALSAAAAAAVLGGLKPLACAMRVEAARTTLTTALLEARRSAYATETTVVVEAAAGDRAVVLRPPGRSQPLGDGVLVASAPADGEIQFRASGLADNATIALACGDARASVVVNQRGVVR